MKRFEHLIAVALSIVILLSFASCSKGSSKMNDESMEMVSNMVIGWNLGNSLDVFEGEGMETETSWGNPKTTEKMILDIKEMGFDTIRIPVTWSKHIDNGKVNTEWMARVREVVNYAYNNDLFVILNSHHDNEYYQIGECVKNDDIKNDSINKMTSLWAQIAIEFKDYNEKLLFETLNEPRTIGSELEWQGGTPEEREVVYELNASIVNAIRSTGGNNSSRFVVVPCYGATADTSVLAEMKLPEDEHIIVSIHAYKPYNFTMNEKASNQFTDDDKKEIRQMFKDINRIFIKKGIPVIIGEFGATNKDNLQDRIDWVHYYLTCAHVYNIPCIVWDNGYYEVGEENFGLYNRLEGNWFSKDLAIAYTTT